MTTVDEYIDTFPEETKKNLQQIREIIKDSAPDATEGIGYGMPSYKVKGKPLGML